VTKIFIVFTLTNFYLIFSSLFQKTARQTINQEKDPLAISFGKKLSLINALQTATIYLDKIIVWRFLGAVPVAIYSFAELPIEKIKTLIPILPLALPKLGENKIDEKRKREIISKFWRLFAVSIPAATLLVLMAPLLYRLFFPQYTESIVYFQALSALVAISPFLLMVAVLVTEMKTRALYAVSMGAPFLKIILFFVLIPSFGIWGAIIAILTAELLRGLLALYFFLKI